MENNIEQEINEAYQTYLKVEALKQVVLEIGSTYNKSPQVRDVYGMTQTIFPVFDLLYDRLATTIKGNFSQQEYTEAVPAWLKKQIYWLFSNMNGQLTDEYLAVYEPIHKQPYIKQWNVQVSQPEKQ